MKKRQNIYIQTEFRDAKGYTALRFAIITQAINEYKHELRNNNEYEVQQLERFFLGEWGEMLSANNGWFIIQMSRQCVLQERERYERKWGDLIGRD